MLGGHSGYGDSSRAEAGRALHAADDFFLPLFQLTNDGC